MYRLIIKATSVEEAVREAQSRNITPLDQEPMEGGWVAVDADVPNDASLHSWYGETPDPPFPQNSLLHFTHVSGDDSTLAQVRKRKQEEQEQQT